MLVGTVSIEKSERVAEKLKKTGVKHYVLNAKNHEREAEIVAQAGRFGAVTISTNMAGRGTDIVLGGNPEFMAAAEAGTKEPTDPNFQAALAKYVEQCKGEREKVLKAGGLHILGTERHESRRIDNQLRGRSGRQGDPGSSRFYMSLEDDLLRIFGADRLKGLMGKIGMEDNEPIEHRWISRAIENAQKKVESHNFDIRKHLLEYDDVMNKQREVVYHRRRELLSGASLKDDVLDMCDALIEEIAGAHGDDEIDPAEWDWKAIDDAFFKQFKFRPGFNAQTEIDGKPIHRPDDLIEIAAARVRQLYDQRETEFTEPGDAADRKDRDAADARRVVERPSARDGSSQGRHRAARLCAAESAGRVSEGRVHDVRVADGGDAAGRRRESFFGPGAAPAGRRADSAAPSRSAS